MRLLPSLLSARAAALAVLAALALAGCVDPTVSSSGQPPLPKVQANPYVAMKDAGIDIPALPLAEIPETHRRQIVAFETDEPVGTIIVNPKTRLLYFVIGENKALRYGISVGRAGFEWSGEAIVADKRRWPTWTPPKTMIARDPSLARWAGGQPGGPTNPLGARAIYLTSNGVDHGYRIHGTPEWRSIGRNASSGCIRMINQDVIDLYNRLQGGERVIVLTARGEMPRGLFIPTPPGPRPVPLEAALPALPEPPPLDADLRPGPPAAIPAAIPAAPPPPAALPAAPALPAATPAAVPAAPSLPAPAPPALPAAAPAASGAPEDRISATCAVPLVGGQCPPGMATP